MKPASSKCMLKCRYCFYEDETSKRQKKDYGMMTVNVFRKIAAHLMDGCSNTLSFAFQGGEPTLAGLDFFRSAVETVNGMNSRKLRICWSIQSNGMLIDSEWCRFFSENGFLVGISLDGPKDINDRNRYGTDERSSFSRVLQTLQMLKKYNVDTNILTVVTRDTPKNFLKIHDFFMKNGFDYQQYIPCLDPFGEKRGSTDWSLDPRSMEEYLKKSFDIWYRDAVSGKMWYHRYFNNLLQILHGEMPEACGMAGRCSCQYVIEADGSVFPCDFYMIDEYKLGNLAEDDMDTIDRKRTEINFISDSLKITEKCKICRWYNLCMGGCRRDRDMFDGTLGQNYYCDAYSHFFEYSIERLSEIAKYV
jgi:uncharacterized protein